VAKAARLLAVDYYDAHEHLAALTALRAALDALAEEAP